MYTFFSGWWLETWKLLLEMAPYLLFGFFVAGILHLFISKERVARHLSNNRLGSVLKASALGVPLPLCSCGVIPVAAHLRKAGAGRGPVLSFLISTPTTGVDSIFATYSLLGPLLALFRPLASLVSGVAAGIGIRMFNIEEAESDAVAAGGQGGAKDAIPMRFGQKIIEMLRYAFVDLIEDVSKWLIIGILAGGAISYIIPDELVGTYLGNPLLSYPLMLAIGIPMYVCATGSIPIAASLILKGMSPGAGFIFLFAGPATNTATLSFVGGKLGRKTFWIYLTVILLTSVAFGALVDYIWWLTGNDPALVGGHMEMLPAWLNIFSAIVLIMLMAYPYLKKLKPQSISTGDDGMVIKVDDMSCEHCKKALDRAIREVEGVDNVLIDLASKQIEIVGSPQETAVAAAVVEAGYHISPSDTNGTGA